MYKISEFITSILFPSTKFRQTHRTTEPNFSCPLGHQTSMFSCPRSKFTCLGQSDLGFSYPDSGGGGDLCCVYEFIALTSTSHEEYFIVF